MAPSFAPEARHAMLSATGEPESKTRLIAVLLTIVLGIALPLALFWLVYRLGSRLVRSLHGVPRRFGGLLDYRFQPAGLRGAGLGTRARLRARPRSRANKPQRPGTGANGLEGVRWQHGNDQAAAGSARPEDDPAPAYEEQLPGPSLPPPVYGTWTPRRTVPQADDGYRDDRVPRRQPTRLQKDDDGAPVPTISALDEARQPNIARSERETCRIGAQLAYWLSSSGPD